MANLKAKLESEGKEVPKLVVEALARAGSRDDEAVWQKALHQEWRDKERVARAETEAKAREEEAERRKLAAKTFGKRYPNSLPEIGHSSLELADLFVQS